MRYMLPDGKEVTARSYSEVVAAMNDEKFTPAKNLDNYRNGLAERVSALYHVDLDISTDKALVEGLVSVGLLTRLP